MLEGESDDRNDDLQEAGVGFGDSEEATGAGDAYLDRPFGTLCPHG